MTEHGGLLVRSLLLAVLLGVACAASAQLYRWTDAQGRVHVTDTPPPPSAKNVRQRATQAGAAAAGDGMPYALRSAVENFPITLYTGPECRPCNDARALLNARGAPFKEVLVTGQPLTEELRKLAGSLSVPVLLVGSSVQKGFEESAYHALLDTAGYPRTGILPPRNQAQPKPAPPAQAAAAAPEAAAPDDEGAGRTPGPYTPR